MAEWVKDPTKSDELWHRVAGRREVNILEMACKVQLPEAGVLERGSSAPAIYFECPDCRNAEDVVH